MVKEISLFYGRFQLFFMADFRLFYGTSYVEIDSCALFMAKLKEFFSHLLSTMCLKL